MLYKVPGEEMKVHITKRFTNNQHKKYVIKRFDKVVIEMKA